MGDTAVVEPEQAEDGAPVEEGAEATRSSQHLFQYSQHVDAGAGAESCTHRTDGACKEVGHVHAVVALPNSLQHADVQAKARAAKARHKRAMRDAGTLQRPPSDAYVTLESELDDLLLPSRRERVLREVAERETRKRFGDAVIAIRDEERFENYEQDAEEYRRQLKIPEEERDATIFTALDEQMGAFASAIEERVEQERLSEIERLGGLDDEALRGILREARIDEAADDASITTYYTWIGFVGTRQCQADGLPGKRYYQSLEDFKNAPPEIVTAIDNAIRDLEGRMARGDAAGN